MSFFKAITLLLCSLSALESVIINSLDFSRSVIKLLLWREYLSHLATKSTHLAHLLSVGLDCTSMLAMKA
ncbi:hypothetical protein HanXRQr2_Chr14g0632391 [Helianthus annuus]|uniref:Secreted protein n=1 Tax=Helianthus annuus TaxID=4232 RepID=A0A251SEX6_HELAN|nr:hypothetical protein HanXRQr2_Chr14g0632391 [Helianthus annuus]KAJ0463432.1 hypothetical protein HanHA300_Chr14g0515611 [Helianthus annuus]KAJ0467533.1 hypothetical protein HanIR_Chr14g0686321 [Helianthus annuus]KAJ0484896.1 hypothetical protein HanHA89_Chr14g0561991 [Helianthus annuus]KAJ0655446.1 hypothetical protein HanLR1_Chr14g0524311 [Helianthus annuus]